MANPGGSFKNEELYHNVKTLQPVSHKFSEKLDLSDGGGGYAADRNLILHPIHYFHTRPYQVLLFRLK